MQLSDGRLALIRTRPQSAKLSLSIFQPTTVMRCRLDNVNADRGDRIIYFDTVSFGSYLSVEEGMTLLVGTSVGSDDVGRIRIKSVTSAYFEVSENFNINWKDNRFLTVLRYWEVWPVYPRIIGDPADAENVVFYKDYDVAYTNQNTVLGTFVCAGPHRGAYLENGSCRQWYTSSGTYNVRGSGLTYDWAFEGGTPTGSTLAHPGFVTYNTPGHYVTRLKVTNNQGGVDITYRYVSIYDKPEDGTNNPILQWEMDELSGSRGEAGYSVAIKVFENIEISDNAVVVIFYEGEYGDTTIELGGNSKNASDIFFVGNVVRGSIQRDYAHGEVSFDVASITSMMKDVIGYAISTESSRNPDTWYEIYDLDVRRALYHYLRWHTTLLSVADFRFIGDDQKIQYFDSDRESAFDAIDNLMRGTLEGNVCADRQGAIFAEVGPVMYSDPTGTFSAIMNVEKGDWMNSPNIERRIVDEYSYVERGGIAYSGAITGTFGAYKACAPGAAPSFRGKVDNVEGLAVTGQNQLRIIAGNIFENHNSKYPSVTMEMSSMFTNLDIAPYEAVTIHFDAEDTPEGVPIDILGTPSEISWRYDAQKRMLLPTVTFESLVNGLPGRAILIPVTPDDDSTGNGGGGGGGGFSVPSLQIPPIPPLTIPPLIGPALEAVRPYAAVYAVDLLTGVAIKDIVFSNTYGTYSTLSSPTAPAFFAITSAGISILVPGFYLVLASNIAFDTVSQTDSFRGLSEILSSGFTTEIPASAAVVNMAAMPSPTHEPYNSNPTMFKLLYGAGSVGIRYRQNAVVDMYLYAALLVMKL